ncbi:hypothetical protein [Polynucleobacter ibericus]|uniref:hypothetical protein n=1 Tax=Polynucleobacter ibericus TaxID=1819725 RepID=UPI001BFCE56C|nr:hypothetical protein [Polynucleobacter ibericus]QWE08173.1 hypothetical protein AOC20_07020 [Polynucleobacter ibericus]
MRATNFFSFMLLAVFAALTSLQAYAAPNAYVCEVVSDSYVKADGTLDLIKESSRIGQKFTVVKKTGEVIGDIMDSLRNPKVAALGSEKNAYKVIWVQKAASKNGAFVDYLSIDEFANGKMKPFGFFSGSQLLTGLCE